MRSRTGGTAAAVVAVMVLAGACEPYYNRVPSPDDLMHRVPWFDHMLGSKAVHPYTSADVPRDAVPGTVPVGGSEGDWEAEFKAGNAATADRLVNPFGMVRVNDTVVSVGGSGDGGPEVPLIPRTIEARGDSLYQTFCLVCHGGSGDGKGPVGPRVGAPSLLTESARGRSDGYLYSIVRYGRGVMPRYGDKVYRPADRWAIVHYVRSLQSAAPAPPPAAPATGGTN